jgi:hypothetical protein
VIWKNCCLPIIHSVLIAKLLTIAMGVVVAHPIHAAVQAVAVVGEFIIKSNKKSIFSRIVETCRRVAINGIF